MDMQVNRRHATDGSVMVEFSMVFWLLIFVIFAGVEMFFAVKASHDLNCILRIGIQTAEFCPAFSVTGSTTTLDPFPGNCDESDYDNCMSDIWSPPPGINCGHFLTQLKMCRAFRQIHNSSLNNVRYTTYLNPDGRINITINSKYVSIIGWDIFGFGNTDMTVKGEAQNFFNTP